MSIRYAGAIIKAARMKANLTQEQLADGICSPKTLSYIETGKLGISSAMFRMLMQKMGAEFEVYPIFNSRKDFDAFTMLKNVRLYLNNKCLASAYSEIKQLKALNFGNSRFHYQEAIYLYCLTLYLTYNCDYDYLLKTLMDAIHVLHPSFSSWDFFDFHPTSVDYEIVFLTANIYINIGAIKEAQKLIDYMRASTDRYNHLDKYIAYLKLLETYTQSKLFFIQKNYSEAKEYSDYALSLVNEYSFATLKIETKLLKIINDSFTGIDCHDKKLFYLLSYASFMECGYISDLLIMLRERGLSDTFTGIDIPRRYTFPKLAFPAEDDTTPIDKVIYSTDALTIGSLIKNIREDQRITLSRLSDGICSISKLSKIENLMQEPGIYLAGSLLNRLGYSERDFVFFGNSHESLYSDIKSFLIAEHIRGKKSSQDMDSLIKTAISSNVPSVKQLGILFDNNLLHMISRADEVYACGRHGNITLLQLTAKSYSSA